ncbi:sigma-70 family RNA polymerase sigma factor [Bythopirellula goksoeyrii]|uniref:sigma-70 family RNA polymerase sigma factor n=1 Tax=Bythopirellula goksoeyrii TaxID=1400387 RepID=UPI00143D9580|nr:sigma-70 family RNA polymerase sigma factor [Bythopirellula goksoeyrii]
MNDQSFLSEIMSLGIAGTPAIDQVFKCWANPESTINTDSVLSLVKCLAIHREWPDCPSLFDEEIFSIQEGLLDVAATVKSLPLPKNVLTEIWQDLKVIFDAVAVVFKPYITPTVKNFRKGFLEIQDIGFECEGSRGIFIEDVEDMAATPPEGLDAVLSRATHGINSGRISIIGAISLLVPYGEWASLLLPCLLKHWGEKLDSIAADSVVLCLNYLTYCKHGGLGEFKYKKFVDEISVAFCEALDNSRLDFQEASKMASVEDVDPLVGLSDIHSRLQLVFWPHVHKLIEGIAIRFGKQFAEDFTVQCLNTYRFDGGEIMFFLSSIPPDTTPQMVLLFDRIASRLVVNSNFRPRPGFLLILADWFALHGSTFFKHIDKRLHRIYMGWPGLVSLLESEGELIDTDFGMVLLKQFVPANDNTDQPSEWIATLAALKSPQLYFNSLTILERKRLAGRLVNEVSKVVESRAMLSLGLLSELGPTSFFILKHVCEDNHSLLERLFGHSTRSDFSVQDAGILLLHGICSSHETLSDEDFLRFLYRDCGEFFETLYWKKEECLIKLGIIHECSRLQLADLIEESLLRLRADRKFNQKRLEQIGSWTDGQNLKKYLFGWIRNILKTQYDQLSGHVYLSPSQVPGLAPNVDLVDWAETIQAFRRAVASLSKRQQLILRMLVNESMTPNEIALYLGVDKSTVSRDRKIIATVLSEYQYAIEGMKYPEQYDSLIDAIIEVNFL